MNRIAKGVWPTMITPFTRDGRIDLELIPLMVDWYVDQGCDGIFAVCQSSEMFFLSLEERTALGEAVLRAAGDRLDVVVSGHVSSSLGMQIRELRAMSALGAKALVLVTNRLAGPEDPDSLWIENAEVLLDALPGVPLGLYECPYPYKRLMSREVLTWCASTGRFLFLKDTCCDGGQIAQKLDWLEDGARKAGVPPIGLYNANSATLLESLRAGAHGFSGTMANLHPHLYAWLWKNYRERPEQAGEVQAGLTLLSSLEKYGYPTLAKQHFADLGIPILPISRSVGPECFGREQLEYLRQAEMVERKLLAWVGAEERSGR